MCLNEVGTEMQKPDNYSAGNRKIQKTLLECETIKSKETRRNFIFQEKHANYSRSP